MNRGRQRRRKTGSDCDHGWDGGRRASGRGGEWEPGGRDRRASRRRADNSRPEANPGAGSGGRLGGEVWRGKKGANEANLEMIKQVMAQRFSDMPSAREARERSQIAAADGCHAGATGEPAVPASSRELKGAPVCRGRVVTRAAGRWLAVRSLAIRSSVCRKVKPRRDRGNPCVPSHSREPIGVVRSGDFV